jgi:hypothetical protein
VSDVSTSTAEGVICQKQTPMELEGEGKRGVEVRKSNREDE